MRVGGSVVCLGLWAKNTIVGGTGLEIFQGIRVLQWERHSVSLTAGVALQCGAEVRLAE